MGFFGFFGPFDSHVDVDGLAAYGRSVADGREPLVARPACTAPHCGWGESAATDAGVTILLQGEPLVRGAGTPHPQALPGSAHALLEAYRQHGDEFLAHIRGRFALAVLDEPRHRALLAVDPMGIERVAYSAMRGGLVFGSSAASVARLPGRAVRIAAQSVFDYLMLHMVPAPGTIFEGVRKLRPGCCAIWDKGVVREQRYWNARFRETNDASFDALRDELHASIRTAVRDCHPGSTTGAFLSGGLDSSTVCGVLSEVGPPPTRTFSIGFGYPDYDELSFARIANARFGCEGHEYVVTGDDIASGFPLIARAYDEPFGNSSALPVYFCARFARHAGVDHLLAGDGGDELFAGNSRYAEQEIFELYKRIPAFVRKRLLEPALATWPDALGFRLVRRGRGYVDKANVPLPIRLEAWNLIHTSGTAEILHPDFLGTVDERRTLEQMQQLWDSAPAESVLNHMLHYDWQYTLADNDLRKVETMSALAGVRVSYPMLHPDVVDMSMRVPPRLKMPGTRLRHFYKQAMTGYLPEAIIHKKKHGFGLPFGLWLQESPELRDRIDSALRALRSRCIVREDFIDRLLYLHGQEDAAYYGVFVWVLAMLEQWFQEHGVSP